MRAIKKRATGPSTGNPYAGKRSGRGVSFQGQTEKGYGLLCVIFVEYQNTGVNGQEDHTLSYV